MQVDRLLWLGKRRYSVLLHKQQLHFQPNYVSSRGSSFELGNIRLSLGNTSVVAGSLVVARPLIGSEESSLEAQNRGEDQKRKTFNYTGGK